MIRVAVCDDEEKIAGEMEKLLLDICNREGIGIDVDVFLNGNELEQEIAKGSRYDLIYMDIQMADGDGITTAQRIREKDENAILVFASAYEKYMIELFRLDVFAFLKKPIENERFEDIFLDATEKIGRKQIYFTYHYKGVEYKLPCMDILYFESRGRKIILHKIRGESNQEFFNGKLSQVERQLDAGKIPFLRIHQSYYVNYHYIRSRSKTEVTLADGTSLKISEDRKKDFGRRYNRLLGDEIEG